MRVFVSVQCLAFPFVFLAVSASETPTAATQGTAPLADGRYNAIFPNARRFSLMHCLKRNNNKSVHSKSTSHGNRGDILGLHKNTQQGSSRSTIEGRKNAIIGISSYRHTYDNDAIQEKLVPSRAHEFQFQRFQSPSSIQKALLFRKASKKSKSENTLGKDSNQNDKKVKKKIDNFTYFHGKDGRKGYVSSKKLGGDWVLAQSKQVAKETTTKDVLEAYLNGSLHERWNEKDVLECHFKCRDIQNRHGSSKQRSKLSQIGTRKSRLSSDTDSINGHKMGKYYQQDLVLRSQRIITSETGIMRYTQTITIDQVGKDNYCVIVRLDTENNHSSITSKKKPFDSLIVHVGLEQNGNDVNIYADGIMEVNRKVVPNLIVFDASGIAGAMAGKGTLWIGAHFEEERKKKVF